MKDNDLIENCFRGNVESYRELMIKYKDYAMAVALNILMNYEDAQDVCLEAAVEAVKQWKYEPYVEDGQPKELVFTVSVKFKL